MQPRSVIVLTLACLARGEISDGSVKLPADFIVGAGTSSYQTEGAWNVSGKGEGLFDHVFHSYGLDESFPNGDVAADSYHRFKEDVAAARDMKLQMYRFSLSWSRLLPKGWPDQVNNDGLRYYNELLKELKDNGIEPMVTLFHFDLPQPLMDEFNGWGGDKMVDAFVSFADFAFSHFGDRVRYWTTHNEPYLFCTFAPHLATFFTGGAIPAGTPTPAPGEEGADYECLRRIVLAHGRAYRLYQENYASKQHGLIGLSNFAFAPRPNSTSYADLAAVRRYNLLTLGTTFGPLTSGDYPIELRRIVDEASKLEGLNKSRLPEFSADERTMLRGTIDFLGLNNYFGQTIAAGKRPERGNMMTDAAVQVLDNDPFGRDAVAAYAQMTPWSLKESALWVWDEYHVPIFVTENGYITDSKEVLLNDDIRAVYHSAYMKELVRSIEEDGVRILGYLAWSLIDAYEWVRQYRYSYGLVHVDYAGGSLNRTLKESSSFFIKLAETRSVPEVTVSSAQSFASPAVCLVSLLLVKCWF